MHGLDNLKYKKLETICRFLSKAQLLMVSVDKIIPGCIDKKMKSVSNVTVAAALCGDVCVALQLMAIALFDICSSY